MLEMPDVAAELYCLRFMANILVFTIAAVFVWRAGSGLTGYLDAIADRTEIGRAFVGMLLLGGITSLPEVAAVTTSALTGNATLAVKTCSEELPSMSF